MRIKSMEKHGIGPDSYFTKHGVQTNFLRLIEIPRYVHTGARVLNYLRSYFLGVSKSLFFDLANSILQVLKRYIVVLGSCVHKPQFCSYYCKVATCLLLLR